MSNPRLASQKDQDHFGKRAPEALRLLLTSVGRYLRRDPISTGLLAASLILLIAFFSLLGSLSAEGHGEKVPLSSIVELGKAERIRTATMLDYDNQVQAATDTGI